MWSFDRRAVLLGLGALAGCGYQPVDAPDGPAAGLKTGEIGLKAPVEEFEYLFVQAAEARLGQTRRPRYELGYTLSSEDVPIGTSPTAVTTRYNVIGRVDWTLTDLRSGAVVTSGGFQTFASYAATDTPVGTEAAAQDARRRLAETMAEQIVGKLGATAAQWRI